MKAPIKNCAVYTRKSTDERLDMEFNTLDAQREACLSYIASQKSEGWVPVLEQYDDGGFSGGNMDRPALGRLLEDIKIGKIQTVVVYKIDRLTRSLMDFAKLVEIFDAHGVTFVSITQSFNTTTSMGRLTLNVLLSFAQFEREVSGERIRDKIAASKRKGMWMGGTLPLGYDIKNKQLIINETEAERVRFIFQHYLKLGCLNLLYRDLKRQGIKSKERVLPDGTKLPGFNFSRTAVHYLLTNPTYIGKIRHKDLIHNGNHQPIITEELWDNVQTMLMNQASAARGTRKIRERNPLRGLIFDKDNNPYFPTYSTKPGMQYRYYQVKLLDDSKKRNNDVLARLPAHEIETRVENAIREQLSDLNTASAFLGISQETDQQLLKVIVERHAAIPAKDLLMEAVCRIIMDASQVTIEVKIPEILRLLSEHAEVRISVGKQPELKEIRTPYITRRAHKGAIMIESDNKIAGQENPFDLPPHEIKNLIRGFVWRDEHFKGKTIRQIAVREKFSEGFVGKCIFRTFELT